MTTLDVIITSFRWGIHNGSGVITAADNQKKVFKEEGLKVGKLVHVRSENKYILEVNSTSKEIKDINELGEPKYIIHNPEYKFKIGRSYFFRDINAEEKTWIYHGCQWTKNICDHPLYRVDTNKILQVPDSIFGEKSIWRFPSKDPSEEVITPIRFFNILNKKKINGYPMNYYDAIVYGLPKEAITKEIHERAFFKNFLETTKMFLENSTKVLAVSEFAKEQIKNTFIDPLQNGKKNITYIYNFLPEDILNCDENLKERYKNSLYKILNDYKYLLFTLGRLTNDKGLTESILAVNAVNFENRDKNKLPYFLLLIGPDQDRTPSILWKYWPNKCPWIKRFVYIKSNREYSAVSRRDYIAMLHALSEISAETGRVYFLGISRDEQHPICHLEAKILGIPIISREDNGVREALSDYSNKIEMDLDIVDIGKALQEEGKIHREIPFERLPYQLFSQVLAYNTLREIYNNREERYSSFDPDKAQKYVKNYNKHIFSSWKAIL